MLLILKYRFEDRWYDERLNVKGKFFSAKLLSVIVERAFVSLIKTKKVGCGKKMIIWGVAKRLKKIRYHKSLSWTEIW